MSNVDFSSYILDFFPDYVYVIDMENYGVVYINKALETLLGNPSEEVWRSTPCYKLLQGKDAPCEFCNSPILKNEAPTFWTKYNPIFKSWITYKDEKINIDGKNYRLEIARDITENVEINEMLQDLFEEKKLLVECVKLLESSQPLEISVKTILSHITNYHDADRAYFFDYDDHTLKTTYAHEYCKENIEEKKSILQDIDFDYFKPMLNSFRKGQAFRVKDRDTDAIIQNDPMCNIELIRHNLTSLIIVPVKTNDGKIIALLGVDNPKTRIYAQSIIEPISTFFLDFFEKQKTIEKLYNLSFTDGLTSLKNSHRFLEDLKEFEISPPKTCGIAYIDINGLKQMNDTEGHDAGNVLIKSCGKILKQTFDKNAYRTGGDEFIVLVPNCVEQEFLLRLSLIKEKAKFENNLRVAIGHSWTDNTVNGLSRYIQEADQAMYTDKKAFYSETGADRRKRD